MIGPLDRLIEKFMKRALHKTRTKMITKTLSLFKTNHPGVPTEQLERELELEADRIYAIVDRSVLRALIQRAKYTFWLTAITSTIVVGVLGAFSAGTALPFITPPLAALAAWFISLVVIPLSYNQRVKGAIDSVVITYERDMSRSSSAEIQTRLRALNQLNNAHTDELALSELPVNDPNQRPAVIIHLDPEQDNLIQEFSDPTPVVRFHIK